MILKYIKICLIQLVRIFLLHDVSVNTRTRSRICTVCSGIDWMSWDTLHQGVSGAFQEQRVIIQRFIIQ